MPEFNGCPACQSPRVEVFEYPEGKIFCCSACPLQWAVRNPEMFPDVIANPDSLYMKPESIPDQANYRPYQDFFAYVVGQINRPKLRIFDVGCGSGVFVDACLEAGHEVMGIERDPLLASYMSERVKSRVRFMPAEKIGEKEGCFDLITFWDSFEHMDDPFAIIKKISSNLTSDGMIFLRVNNRHDVYNKLVDFTRKLSSNMGRKLLQGCFNFPDHVWNFGLEPMRTMLAKAGFEIVHFRPDDTPAERLTRNRFVACIFKLAYLVNRSIGGGKAGEYFIRKIRS